MPKFSISSQPVFTQDNVDGLQPSKWYGKVAPSGTLSPWKDVAAGSEYTAVVSGTAIVYIKKTSTSAATDWKAVTTA